MSLVTVAISNDRRRAWIASDGAGIVKRRGISQRLRNVQKVHILLPGRLVFGATGNLTAAGVLARLLARFTNRVADRCDVFDAASYLLRVCFTFPWPSCHIAAVLVGFSESAKAVRGIVWAGSTGRKGFELQPPAGSFAFAGLGRPGNVQQSFECALARGLRPGHALCAAIEDVAGEDPDVGGDISLAEVCGPTAAMAGAILTSPNAALPDEDSGMALLRALLPSIRNQQHTRREDGN